MLSEPCLLCPDKLAELEKEYVVWHLVEPSLWEAKAEQDIGLLLSHIAALATEGSNAV